MSVLLKERTELDTDSCLSNKDTFQTEGTVNQQATSLQSIGAPPQTMEEVKIHDPSPKQEENSEEHSDTDDEFHDCEDEASHFANTSSLSYQSTSNSSNSIYQSFTSSDHIPYTHNNNNVDDVYDIDNEVPIEIDWKQHNAFQPRSIMQFETSIPVDEKWSVQLVTNDEEVPLYQDSKPLSSSSSLEPPDMLVTLTSAHMGISAKNDTSSNPEYIPINDEGILETSIFDKAKLDGTGLDTEEINRSVARIKEEPMSGSSHPHQEKLINDRQGTHLRDKSGMRSDRNLSVHGMESISRSTTNRFRNGIPRAQSAPTEIKETGVPIEEIDADAEITEILNRRTPDTPRFNHEERAVTSLSEPFRSIGVNAVDDDDDDCTKSRYSKWNRKKLSFVSYDTESESGSIAARSDTTIDCSRRELSLKGTSRSRTSSTVRYATGVVRGPRVSPVPRGGIRDFSRTEVFALNRKMSSEPQLINVDMREWSSKYIGFQSAADYYARMICDLAFQNINILALIKSRLGDSHPLVAEIIEKLINGTSELPSFVLGREIVHRCYETKKPHRENGTDVNRDHWCNRVETTLIRCGLNTTFFDRYIHPYNNLISNDYHFGLLFSPSSAFKSEQEYFEYIAHRMRVEGFKVSSRVLAMLRDQLGDDHPFIAVLKRGRIVKTDNESGRSSSQHTEEEGGGLTSRKRSTTFTEKVKRVANSIDDKDTHSTTTCPSLKV
eukprot:g8388.t1